MSDTPYDRFSTEELILRDELAIDRTLLANERTLLAYGRTGLALIVGGITLAHFGEYGILLPMGLALIPLGVVIMAWGYYRYRRMNAAISRIRRGLSRR